MACADWDHFGTARLGLQGWALSREIVSTPSFVPPALTSRGSSPGGKFNIDITFPTEYPFKCVFTLRDGAGPAFETDGGPPTHAGLPMYAQLLEMSINSVSSCTNLLLTRNEMYDCRSSL